MLCQRSKFLFLPLLPPVCPLLTVDIQHGALAVPAVNGHKGKREGDAVVLTQARERFAQERRAAQRVVAPQDLYIYIYVYIYRYIYTYMYTCIYIPIYIYI